MFDFMINHTSRQSKYYKRTTKKSTTKVPTGPLSQLGQVLAGESSTQEADVDLIYKRKDRAPKQKLPLRMEQLSISGILSGGQIDLDAKEGHGLY